ncbi:recombining binding protein suppressor of hairless-like protein isoform X1 [Cervus elaphus]|uniref:recombining binding protein suppressor of hairless-like protein isoform X1 n=1 Tax=Cervus elaphus TaxID=9860 RepID=UPI001CC27726|nr:recombining binding protein suppressor of hairless-like protein isoform X1 [Cervus elaphus]
MKTSLSSPPPKWFAHSLHSSRLSCQRFLPFDPEGGGTGRAPSSHSLHSICPLGSLSSLLWVPGPPPPSPRSASEPSAVLREGVRRCLQQQCEQTVRILHAKVAQKSYGNEKRFFCPPPCVYLAGPGWRVKPVPGQAHQSGETGPLVCGYMGLDGASGSAAETQKLNFEEQPDSREFSCAKTLYISDADKRKHFRLVLRLMLRGGRELGTFHSRLIKVISKPSQKKQSLKNTDLCISSGSKVSLFNRLRSQTVSTRYLSVEDGDFVASARQWAAFTLHLGNPTSRPGAGHFTGIHLFNLHHNWPREVNVAPWNRGSQTPKDLSKVLVSQKLNPALPPDSAPAPRAQAFSRMGHRGFLQAENFQPELPLRVPTPPLRPTCDTRRSQRQQDLGQKLRTPEALLPSVYSSADEHCSQGDFPPREGYVRYGSLVQLVCTVTGITLPPMIIRKVAKQCALLDVDEPISQLHKCAFQFTGDHPGGGGTYLCLATEKVVQFQASPCPKEANRALLNDSSCWTIIGTESVEFSFSTSLACTREPVTPVPLISTLELSGGGDVATLELHGENFHAGLKVWFGDVEAETMYRSPRSLVCVVPDVAVFGSDWRWLRTPITVPVSLVRTDGLFYPSAFSFTYTPEYSARPGAPGAPGAPAAPAADADALLESIHHEFTRTNFHLFIQT